MKSLCLEHQKWPTQMPDLSMKLESECPGVFSFQGRESSPEMACDTFPKHRQFLACAVIFERLASIIAIGKGAWPAKAVLHLPVEAPWIKSAYCNSMMNQKFRKAIIIITMSTIPLAIVGRAIYKAETTRRLEHLRTKVWPAERKLTAEKVLARQAEDQTRGAVTIDLKPFINARLTEAPMCYKGTNADNFANNLAEVPVGKRIYAGVPFDVQGTIQLMGGWLQRYGKTFPSKIESIPVNRPCTKIHLLHGEGAVHPKDKGTTAAMLVINYQDGSTKKFDMVAGKQVFDWWSPTFTTGAPFPILYPERMRTPAPGTELAWIGSNPWVRRWYPDYSLCLFRTTFENPQPAVPIATVSYVSTETVMCPFLVALTVE
jgi:hypothetical protein